MKKRIIAFLIIFVMAIQSFPAFAANDFENSDSAAVRFVVALGLMGVDEHANRFWNDVPVTRIEFAEIICKMCDLAPSEDPNGALFDDVNAEQRKYAETVARNGYMSGYGNGCFGPDDYLTKSQLLAVIVKVMGGQNLAEAAGGYPSGYIEAGRKFGLRSSILNTTDTYARQIDVANAIYDAMHADVLSIVGVKNNSIQYGTKEGYTFLSENLDIYMHEGVMVADEVTSLDQPGGAGENMVKIGGQLFYDTNGLTDGFLGYSVVVYEKHADDEMYGEIIYIEASKDNEVVFIDGINSIYRNIDDRKVTYYENERSKKINLDYAVSMIYNGVAEDFDANKISSTCDEIYFIDNNDDRLYETVIIYEYEDFLVKSTRTEESEVLFEYNARKLVLDDCVARIYKDEQRISISEFKPGDIISVATSRNEAGEKCYTIRMGNGNISGTIEKFSVEDDYNEVIIDGETYRISSSAETYISQGQLGSLRAKDNGVFKLNARNEIASWELNVEEEVAYLCGWKETEIDHEDALQLIIFTQRGELKKIASSDKIRIDGKRYTIEEILNNSDFVSNLNTRQLIKVVYTDDTVKEILFPKKSYNKLEFSRDSALVNRKCTRNSIFEEKYAISDKTIVFSVPVTSYSNLNAQGIVSVDESDYTILKKGFVAQGKSAYTELYDVQENGDISYILAPYVVGETFIKDNSSLLLVSKCQTVLDEYGDVVESIEGYGDTGNEVKLYGKYDYQMIDSALNRQPKCGDVIQYATNKKGEVVDISIVCSNEEDEFDYAVSSIIGTTDIDFLKIYGRAGFVTDSRVGVYIGDEPDNPMGMDAIVNDSGSAVFRVDGQFIEPIQFSDIDVRDEVFAVKNRSDQTKIFVVYE